MFVIEMSLMWTKSERTLVASYEEKKDVVIDQIMLGTIDESKLES